MYHEHHIVHPSLVVQHGFLQTTESVYIHNFLMLFGKMFSLLLVAGNLGLYFCLLYQMFNHQFCWLNFC